MTQSSVVAHAIDPTSTGVATAVANGARQSNAPSNGLSIDNSILVTITNDISSIVVAIVTGIIAPVVVAIIPVIIVPIIADKCKLRTDEKDFEAWSKRYKMQLQDNLRDELQEMIGHTMERGAQDLYTEEIEEFFYARKADASYARRADPLGITNVIEASYTSVEQIIRLKQRELEKRSRIKLQAFIKKLAPGIFNLSGGLGLNRTLYLKTIALRVAKSDQESSIIPIYINLKDFEATLSGESHFIRALFCRISEHIHWIVQPCLHDNSNLLKFISDKLHREYGSALLSRRKIHFHIKKKIQDGKILLLLNGTDDMSEAKEESLCESIIKENFEKRLYKGCLVIIATQRTIKYNPHTGCEKLIIDEDIILKEVYDFIERCKNECKDKQPLQDSIYELEIMLKNSLRLCTFASTPITLLYMISVCTSQFDRLRRPAELYQKYVEEVLLCPLRHESINEKQDSLGQLAWRLHRTHQYFSEDDISCYEEEHKITRELLMHCFSSIVLQEYFAARYVSKHREESFELCKCRNNLWWEEVILLYIQMAKDCEEFVKDLAGLNAGCTGLPSFCSDEYVGLLLAARGLATVGQQITDEVRIQLYGLLMSSGTPLFIQLQIAGILWEAGTGDVSKGEIDWLLKIASALSGYEALKVVLQTACEHLKDVNEPVSPLFLPLLCNRGVANGWTRRRHKVKIPNFDFASMTNEEFTDMLIDKTYDYSVRERIIYTLCIQKDSFSLEVKNEIACALKEILKKTDVDLEVRKSIAFALGALGYYELVCKLLKEETSLDEDIQWHLINALGTFRSRDYLEIVAQLKNLRQAKHMWNGYLRLNIDVILSEDNHSQLDMSNAGDYVIRALVDVLKQEGSERSIEDLLKILRYQPQHVSAQERVWICEILERVSKNGNLAEQLKNIWSSHQNGLNEQLKEALAHMQWVVTRRQTKTVQVMSHHGERWNAL
jgi:hypothetical protein